MRADMTELTIVFRNCVKAPKTYLSIEFLPPVEVIQLVYSGVQKTKL